MAEQRWRRLDGPQLLPLVRAGVSFPNGLQQERGHNRSRQVAA